jgi:hypothetical protein
VPSQELEFYIRESNTEGGSQQPLTAYRPGAKDFVLAKRFESAGGNSSDSDGVAESVENLDRIAFRAVRSNVTVYELDNVATLEAMLGDIAGQDRVAV